MIIYKIWGLAWLENYWIMMIQSVFLIQLIPGLLVIIDTNDPIIFHNHIPYPFLVWVIMDIYGYCDNIWDHKYP